MGIDELEEAKGSGEEGNNPSQGSQAPAPQEEEDRGARVDAAKAFFRAMYAGEEAPAGSSFGQEGSGQDTSTQTACRNCESLGQLAKEAEQKANENEQLYKRMAADFENYRKRMDREREESQALGVKKTAEAIMPALDDLDRALAYLKTDTPIDKVIDSFKLVASRILQSVETVGLKPIEAVGQPFNPRFHEPVQQIETTEHPDGTVIQELRRGYMIGDRVVRPSLVNVASNSGSHEKAAAASESEEQLDQTVLSQADPGDQIAAGSEVPPGRVYDLGDIADEGEQET